MSTENKKNRIKRVVAVSPVYRNKPYFVVPAILDDQSPRLCKSMEMLKEENVSETVQLKFVKDIIKMEQYPLQHNRILRVDENLDDKKLWLFLTGVDGIALKQKDIKRNKHVIYIEDLEEESTEKVELYELQFKAQEKVMKLPLSKYQEAGIWILGKEVTKLSPTRVKEKMLEVCMNNPNKVFEYFSDKGERLFVKKLVYYGILSDRGTGFYEKDTFIGRTEGDVIGFMQHEKNLTTKEKWGMLLEAKEGKKPEQE